MLSGYIKDKRNKNYKQSYFVPDLSKHLNPYIDGEFEDGIFTPNETTEDSLDIEFFINKFDNLNLQENKYVIIADSYFGSLECAEKLGNKINYIMAVKKNIDTNIKGKDYGKVQIK